MVKNRQICLRTAIRLVNYLKTKGIATDTDFAIQPIKKILRECFYVRKIKECGFKDCIYVELPDAGSFFAVLEDGRLMTGFHIMKYDAIRSILCDLCLDDMLNEEEVDFLIDKSYFRNCEEEGMLIISLNKFQDFLDKRFPFSIGDKVIWNDPDESVRDTSRIYEIDSIKGETIIISDDYSMAEVFNTELFVVQKLCAG